MILVTGSTGFLGKRVCNLLTTRNLEHVGISRLNGPDLQNKNSTLDFSESLRPKFILNCASFVGGIQFGYKYPADIFHNNLEMTLNLLYAANKINVKRIVNPISNCAYPANATLFKENEFWDGPLHDSVLTYGFVRKASYIGSLAYSQQYDSDSINLVFSNMYGPEDHFEEQRSHAIGALIMKIVQAHLAHLPAVTVWGSGTPVREWLHVDDAAEAMYRSLSINSYEHPINVGVGKGISIRDVALLIKEVVGYQGNLYFDTSKPDGAPFKTVDGSLGAKIFNWIPSRNFKLGLTETIQWYINNYAK